MYLCDKAYTAPEKPERIIPDIKDDIKALIPQGGRMSYEEIVKSIQASNPVMTNDDVILQIKEVHDEWYPPVEEPVEEPMEP